jgi:hypothetical protein
MREESGPCFFMTFVEMVMSRHLPTSTTSIALVFAGLEIHPGQYLYKEKMARLR